MIMQQRSAPSVRSNQRRSPKLPAFHRNDNWLDPTGYHGFRDDNAADCGSSVCKPRHQIKTFSASIVTAAKHMTVNLWPNCNDWVQWLATRMSLTHCNCPWTYGSVSHRSQHDQCTSDFQIPGPPFDCLQALKVKVRKRWELWQYSCIS